MSERPRLALWTTPEVGRFFLTCKDCQRVIPKWRVIKHRAKKNETGTCQCGCPYFQPRTIPEWKAAYWLLIRGWFWRKLICRNPDWEPRMPWRHTPADPS